MKNYRTELSQRVRYALIAGMAGAFLIPQVAFAAPTGEHNYTTGVNVDRNTANTTKITSTATNNVINWRDYSVNKGETVQYDGGVTTGTAAHNYLNIVTGANTSNINGEIKGGNHVYIVNPNGVIFGKNAEVNVGHLHVSTQAASTVNTAADMAHNVSPLDTSVGLSDVVNMGKDITANTVEVHGKNIRFLNAAKVHTTASPVVFHTDTANGGYAHIGYKSGSMPTTTDYQVNGAVATAADNYYQLVSTKEELAAINTTNLAGNYMLENDINFENNPHIPIGGNTIGGITYGAFTGKFDGNFFQIKNINVSGVDNAGLFGVLSSARVENVGVVGGTISSKDDNGDETAGGIAGKSNGAKLYNVYVKGTKVDNGLVGSGGLVGYTKNTTIDSAYSTAQIGTDGGGIAGDVNAGTVITNVYNAATYIANSDTHALAVGLVTGIGSMTVEDSYTKSSLFAQNDTVSRAKYKNVFVAGSGGSMNKLSPTITKNVTAYTVDSYSGMSINNTGAPGAKWRIYEGRTLPLLTAFMGVSSETTYNYRYFDGAKQPSADTGNTAKSNGGKDITAEYNSYYLKIVNGSNSPGGKANAQFGAGADTSKVIDYIGTDQDFDRTNGIRNAGTKAILWTGQDGPNLRGVNVTITPRDVRLDGGKINPKRMYNGKSDATKAFIDALTSGDVSSSGFTQEDIKAGTVALDFDTGHFKAQMADKNVGTDKTVTFSGTIGFTGTDKDNYTFDGSSLSTLQGKATITKAPLYLAIAKKRADDKIYDGTSVVKDDAMKQTVGTPNITLDKSKTGLTLAQINAGTPAMLDGAIMTGDDDTTPDDVNLTNVNDPKYTNDGGTEQFHAGDHKLQYTGVGLTGTDAGNYELYYTPENGTKTEITDGNVYLDGKIIPRQILRDDFNVYDKTTHAKIDAKKVYDGNDEYTPSSNVYISSNATASSNTGIVDRDRDHITFALGEDGADGKGHFTQADGTTGTKNVSNAAKVAYTVKGQTDDADLYRLSDYYIMEGTTRKSLGDMFHATGAGKITPKVLTATVRNNHITKVYDAMDDQTDGKRTKTVGDTLVTLDGFVTVNGVKESRTNTSTAKYATKNVVLDGSGNPTTQSVTYTASFDSGTGVEADNYTLGAEGVTPIATTKTLTGGYTGTITPRKVTVKFADVTKIYDGTVTNTQITASDLNDGLNKDVLNADHIGVGNLSTSGVTSKFGDNKTTATFRANVNAGSRSVEYTGLSNSLGTNYTLANTQYGDGTITRRRIDKSGFRVYNADNTVADATKVYDGNDRYTLASGAYLTGTPASGDTGVVSRDYGKVTFALKTGSTGHFASDADGNNRTSHVSEAHHVAYDVVARSSDLTNHPLTNYTFGSAAEETAGTLRNLETVNDTNPAHVTAAGSITPASLRAATQEISKVYDGLTAHTDGNRNPVKGDTVVSFTGWAVHDGTTEKRTNSSTAEYATKDVAYDGSGNVIKKSVTYTGQLTGQYADDYQIVDAGNHVISTANGSGATKTVTMNAPITVADAGKITRRKLKVTMGAVEKTYNNSAKNTTSNITGFTDDPTSTVLGTILSGDRISAGTLQTTYNNMLTATPATATSTYGRGRDSAFTPDANASNGTAHDVQYTNLDKAFKNAFASHEKNYEVEGIAYGKGTIKRFTIDDSNANKVTFAMKDATKVYDGTKTVKYNESDAPAQVRNYINTATLHLDGGGTMEIGGGFTAASGTYDTTADVNGGRRQGVTYQLTYTGGNLSSNIAIASGTVFKGTGFGFITPKPVTATVKGSLKKIYDGTPTAMGVAADTQGSVVSEGAHIVTIDGLVAGATNASTAVFTSKDAGEGNREVKYTVGIDAAHAGNYKIVDASNNAVTTITTNNNTITKRKVDLTFAPVSKDYDGTSENTQKTATVSANDATVLARDKNSIVSGTALQNVTWGTSAYGTGTTDAAFKADPNTGAKSVRYKDTGASMRTALGDAAKNYVFKDNSYGEGRIDKAQINAADLDFAADLAKKVYDGQKTVKKDGSAAKNDVKKYITKAEATVNGKTIKLINDLDLDMQNTQYTSPNATNGTEVDVDYVFKLSNRNVEVAGGNSFTLKGKGTIDRRVLTLKLAEDKSIDKNYDRTADLVDTDARKYTKFTDDDALGNVTYAAGATTKNENKLVRTANGAGVNDGAQMTITANYADRNVVRGSDGKPSAQDITYNVKIAGTIGKNYTLSDGTTKVNAEEGLTTLKAKGTINPRKLQLNFKSPDPRPYDTTAENQQIALQTSNEVTALGSNVGATMLSDDGVVPSAFTLTNVTSSYDNANAGTNKLVTFYVPADALASGLRNNYELADRSYARGTITRSTVGAGDFNFTIDPAKKVYDGTKAVKHSSGDARSYFTNSTVTFNRGTIYERTMQLNRDDITLTKAEYNSADVADANTVDYDITINSNNFDFGGASSIVKQKTTAGTITPLDLTTQLPKYLYKEYDAEQDFNGANQDFVAAQTREGLVNGLLKRDDGNDEDYLDYAVQGHYHTADATIADKAAADANVQKLDNGETITAGTKVDYKLSFKAKDFSSDPAKAATAAKRAQNYTIFGTTATSGEAKNHDADIYRKTLTLTMGRIDKDYDGSDRTITSPDITIDPSTFAGTDNFSFNDAAAGKITGKYDGTDVKRAEDGTVLDRIVTYTDFDKALEELAKTKSKAKNYRIDDQQGVGKILPRKITHDELKTGLKFEPAEKEYDGTRAVVHKSGDVKNYLNDAHVDVTVGSETKRFELDKNLISIQSATYDSPNVSSDKAEHVTYVLSYDNRQGNFELAGGTALTKETPGTITPRKIYAEVHGLNPTKTYNTSEAIVGEAYNGGIRPITEADLQNHVTYRHYVKTDTGHTYDGNVLADSDKTKLRTNMTAQFSNANVAWKSDKWRNEKHGDAKDVTYTFSLAGDAAAENYEFVDANGNALENEMNGTTRSAKMTRADGRIDPYRIELRAQSRELRAGEGLPSVFEGTPSGSNYKTPLNERLSGTIRYTAPSAQARWGDYPINGYYTPAGENESVYKNYFFEAIPGTLHVSYYAPDYEYYKALTQTSKMLPDEYAYENASLDRRSHFGRDAEAEIDYMPPSINMVKDGVDISKTDIRIADETVFSLVNEVFGA